MARYSATDCYWSDDGDFILSANKDLEDTSTEIHRSLIQSIKARLNFNRGEWPGRGNDIGANISDFQGKPNTRATGDQLKIRIISELTKGGFISINDLVVTIVPIDKSVILAKIVVRTGSTSIIYQQRFSLRENPHGNKGDLK